MAFSETALWPFCFFTTHTAASPVNPFLLRVYKSPWAINKSLNDLLWTGIQYSMGMLFSLSKIVFGMFSVVGLTCILCVQWIKVDQQVKIWFITITTEGLGLGWSQMHMVGVLRYIRGGSGLILKPRDVAIVPCYLRFSTTWHGG